MRHLSLLRGFLIVPLLIFTTAMIAQPDADLPSDDQVFLDDLIVEGSGCFGLDCSNGESFGFDTIRLKENNLRIKFQDTSTSASFPSNDWQLTANDSSNGGKNKFSIDDIDGGRTPFTIEASAPSHSLYVEDGGRIGFGTDTPVVNLHVKEGNTPTLRLEQDGSNGFTPQTWDLAGNEANFFLRDATNGSRLPIQVKPAAPTASIFIAADGDTGLGTASPTAPLDVFRSDGTARALIRETNGTVAGRNLLAVENNGPARFTMENTSLGGGAGFQWQMQAANNGNFTIQDNSDSAIQEFVFENDGDLVITGELTTATFNSASDYRLKKNVEQFEDGLDEVLKMNPISYLYNGKAGLKSTKRYLGLGAQDVLKVTPYLVDNFDYVEEDKDGNTKSSESYYRINSAGLTYLLINAIKDQHDIIEQKEERIEALEEKVDQLPVLEDKIAELERRMDAMLAGSEELNVLLKGHDGAFIGQNEPNPYDAKTRIEYFIPEGATDAQINFFDLSGKVLKTMQIRETGKGFVNVTAEDLPSGVYSYSLSVDNSIIDSKKMIVSK